MIRIEYILLHSDAEFPLEGNFSKVFMPEFWKNPDQLAVDGDHSVQFDDPGIWNYLELEMLDDTRSPVAVFRVDSVRERNYPSSPRFSDVNMDELIVAYRNGRFNSFSQTRSMKGWALTSLQLETDDVRMRKAFYQSVDRFIAAVNAVVVYPELMGADEFRSFHSLVQDVVEVEVEPTDEDGE